MRENKFKNLGLRNHSLIETGDGSLSAFSKTYGENFHNTTGAASETIIHYVEGCKVEARARAAKTFAILEVGLGLGVGVVETWKALKSADSKILFTSLEIDEELPLYLKESHPFFRDLERAPLGFGMTKGNFQLEILLGDARKTLPGADRKYQAIYQDAFSPKRNATLWTKEWFELLREKASNDCLMSTYSSSSSIRKAMLAAGWKITKGVKFGPKRSSTRASLQGESDQDILEHLDRSPAILLTDANAADYHL